MKALAISDIHLERRGLRDVPLLNKSFDLLICAGDIWEGQPEKAVQSVVDLSRGKPAIIVPGNHDFYAAGPDRRTISEVLKLMRQEADRHNAQARGEIVTILSADNHVYEIEQVRFIGLPLWSDWDQAGRWMNPGNDLEWATRARALATHMKTAPREYGAIRTERGNWTPYDAVAEHARERAILVDELVSNHDDGPTVVVTHHPPLAQCVDAYQNIAIPWWAPAFYTSNLLATLPEQFQPDLWICGHVHAPFDSKFGRTRVISNPVEGGKFNPNLVIEIHNDG